MKITSIESILVKIPYDSFGPRWEMAGKALTTLDILFVRVETDEGITGWGEAFGHTVCAGTKATLDSMVAPLFVGRDPTDITGLMREAAQRTHIFGRNGSVHLRSQIVHCILDTAVHVPATKIHRHKAATGFAQPSRLQ